MTDRPAEKLSISVPPDLWDFFRAEVGAGGKPSRIIQEALALFAVLGVGCFSHDVESHLTDRTREIIRAWPSDPEDTHADRLDRLEKAVQEIRQALTAE